MVIPQGQFGSSTEQVAGDNVWISDINIRMLM
jgi:hypothetical protein